MKKLADDLYLLRGFPPHAINVFLMGDVVVDSGTRHAAGRILRQLKGRPVTAHAITHAHADHQGSSHVICEELGLPLLCGAGDADAMEEGSIADLAPVNVVTRWQTRHWAGPAHLVTTRLREGDMVGGFTVLETPGHTPGHVVFWREADRVALVGDVLNRRPSLAGSGLQEPPAGFTIDRARNREAIRRLADLSPSLLCFAHGKPLRNTYQLDTLVKRLDRKAAGKIR
ncbi:MBL fold metallo-hydrolase [Kribbella antibiotica]|uniref:MBL fold metallo-hydrolase n=1 Tax=Kribbella antibiotica TaxID=190195 RepID=A0A4R4ZLI9_9ACTN|nr:MBL fold metallo-hydrolase [Kribbella antibiotica]TDD57682.1 MBL fold metallo-hydrolase [Kribbella antibiotica]